MAAPTKWQHGRMAAPSARREVGSAGRCSTRTRIIPSCRDGAVAAGSIGGVPRRWCCSGSVSACAGGAGGDALELSGHGKDKGEVGNPLDKVWTRGRLAGDDQKRAAHSGHRHAEIGIGQSVPKPAWACLSSLEALNLKWLRHQMDNEEGNNFHVEGFC